MPGNNQRRLTGGRRGTGVCPATLLVLCFTFLSRSVCLAQVQREVTEPKLSSVFPLGGRRGTNAQVEVRGNLLAGAYAVWFDSGGLSGRVLKVEEVKEEVKEKASSYQKKPEKPPVVYRALIDVEIQPTAPLEIYSLRLSSWRRRTPIKP